MFTIEPHLWTLCEFQLPISVPKELQMPCKDLDQRYTQIVPLERGSLFNDRLRNEMDKSRWLSGKEKSRRSDTEL